MNEQSKALSCKGKHAVSKRQRKKEEDNSISLKSEETGQYSKWQRERQG